ncbi:MAG: hypothetical protein JWO33_1228 [Caulobacteraceae bacterium]|nr:hypothetical protein [Caulobacteraceae bacterium]
MVNLKQLQHFVAVAEERHFSRAAQRLGMAQPPLSQSISRLEDSLGFQLLERTRRSVNLTPAGEGFLNEVRPALQQIRRAVITAERISKESVQSISIGFVAAALMGTLPAVLRRLRGLAPECAIKLRMMSTNPQRQALLEGSIDIGLMFPLPGPIEGLSSCPIEQIKIVLAIPEDWPLASRDVVSLKDLRDVPLIMFPQDRRPDVYAAWMAECLHQGFAPRIELESPDPFTTFGLVAAGMGVGIAFETSAGIAFPGVKFTSLLGVRDYVRLGLSMAWVTDVGPSSLADLITDLADHFRLVETVEGPGVTSGATLV